MSRLWGTFTRKARLFLVCSLRSKHQPRNAICQSGNGRREQQISGQPARNITGARSGDFSHSLAAVRSTSVRISNFCGTRAGRCVQGICRVHQTAGNASSGTRRGKYVTCRIPPSATSSAGSCLNDHATLRAKAAHAVENATPDSAPTPVTGW